MLFAVIVLLLLAGVTYYHYVQGIFTAAISLVCAFVATLVAFGYYEPLSVQLASGAAMADYAPAMLLAALFGLTYIVLRVIFDSVVPGNLRLPLLVDRIGAGILGFFAGMMATGVFAVTAQLLPFGPAVGMYARYPLAPTRTAQVKQADAGGDIRQDMDVEVRQELVNPEMNVGENSKLLVPVDEFAVSIASLASSGAYQGSVSFPAIHQDLLSEAFGLRIGAESNGRRMMLSSEDKSVVSVAGILLLPANTPAVDFEIPSVREAKKSLTLSARGALVVVRVNFTNTVADGDGHFRLTPGAVRLVINGKTYRPVGFMTPTGAIAVTRADDLMIVPMQSPNVGGDFVFAVEPSDVAALSAKKPGAASSAPPFIEFKMLGRADVSKAPVSERWSASPGHRLLTKPGGPAHRGPTPATPATPPTPAPPADPAQPG